MGQGRLLTHSEMRQRLEESMPAPLLAPKKILESPETLDMKTSPLSDITPERAETLFLGLSSPTYALGWLEFSTTTLTFPTFEPFTVAGTQGGPNFVRPSDTLHATKTAGYVDVNLNSIDYLMSFAPSGGAPLTTMVLPPYVFGSLTFNPFLFPWCFDRDLIHIWQISFVLTPSPALVLAYDLLGTPVVKTTFALGYVTGFFDLTMDPSTGFIYLLRRGGSALIYLDQVDQSGTIRNSVQITGFTPGGVTQGFIAASNGTVYLNVNDNLNLLAPQDQIWKVNPETGAGATASAFTAQLGVPLAGLAIPGGLPPPLRQRQRDDGLAQYNGPRAITAGPNNPTSLQKSIRQGTKNTYL